MNNKVKIGALTLALLCTPVLVSAQNTITSSTTEVPVAQTSESVIEESSTLESQEPDVRTVETTESSSEEVAKEKSAEEKALEFMLSDTENEFPADRSDLYPDDIKPSVRAIETPYIGLYDSNTPQKGFIDVSSHNGVLSIEQYRTLKNAGVTGVVVKLTEATSYINPLAQGQINNAKKAGLKVSAYHYSWHSNNAQARLEADYFAQAAVRFGLDKSTVMVNDIEDPKIFGKADHNATSLAFQKRLNELGFGNVTHYVGAYWITSGAINPNKLGYKNIWVAAYPYQLSSQQQYSNYGAWQWSSKLTVPGISGTLDISSDYSGKFIQPKAPTTNGNNANSNTNTSNSNINGNFQQKPNPSMGLWYRSHVADKGWLGYAGTEYTSGTTGENRRLEAIDVRWNKEKNSIRSSFQDINGRWVEVGTDITGTTGQALAIQRVCFASNDDLLKTGRKIQYRVHSQDIGWSAWKEEGSAAGTTGKKIEAIEMRMIKNGVVEKG